MSPPAFAAGAGAGEGAGAGSGAGVGGAGAGGEGSGAASALMCLRSSSSLRSLRAKPWKLQPLHVTHASCFFVTVKRALSL